MRILILTPTALPDTTGNAVTAERWRRLLAERGHEAFVVAAERASAEALAEEAGRLEPDLVHVHHIFRAGRRLLEPAAAARFAAIPRVLSTAGTDLNEDALEPGRAAVLDALVRGSRLVLAQSQAAFEQLRRRFPGRSDRIRLVPKSVLWMGEAPLDLKKASGFEPDCFLFFHPAGIRPVKRNLECLQALQRIWEARPRVRVLFAGPALDEAYAARFRREVEKRSAFARWIPRIEPDAMRSAYAGADAVLNVSSSEGLSNVILEAMDAGRPVLASDIPGNRCALNGSPGSVACGLLFDLNDPKSFTSRALSLVDDEALGKRLAQEGRSRLRLKGDRQEEAEALTRAYREARALHE